ncbi:zinc finger protein 16 [Trichonephila inaurata madagascariensis]|uniref:Zinc finger protein 16 n=1 Tax=Trichonephila inaurata madagascariensis TaxID=2747483 RepID=A0A8X6X5I7_9ARAC|nr:zinc finger protein 16 [Trichonephila inaurata madagascariensis]
MTSLICLKCNEELLNLHAAEKHDCCRTEIKLEVNNEDEIKLETFHAEQAFDNDRSGFNGTFGVSVEINAEMYGANTFPSYGSSSLPLNNRSAVGHRNEKIPFENCIRIPEKITDRNLRNLERFSQSHSELYKSTATKICSSENAPVSGYFPANVESGDPSSNIQSHVNDQDILNCFSRQTFSNEQLDYQNECSVSNHAFVELKQNGGNEGWFKNSGIDREQVNASDNRFDMDKFTQKLNFPFTGIALANSKTTKANTTVHKSQSSPMSYRNNLFNSYKKIDGINLNSNLFLDQGKMNNDYSFPSTSLTCAEKCENHAFKAKFPTESDLAVHWDTNLKGDHTLLGQEWDERVESEASIHSDVNGSKRDMYNKELGTKNSFTKNSQGPSAVKSFQSDQCSKKNCVPDNRKKPYRRLLYHCNECRMIIDEANLIEHKRLHTEEKILSGDECSEILKIRDLTKSRPFHKNACGECSKIFPCTKNLRRHNRIHTGERPYECNQYHRTFNQNNNLTSHKRLHTGTKPFDCPKCLKKFTRKATLKKHKCI